MACQNTESLSGEIDSAVECGIDADAIDPRRVVLTERHPHVVTTDVQDLSDLFGKRGLDDGTNGVEGFWGKRFYFEEAIVSFRIARHKPTRMPGRALGAGNSMTTIDAKA